MRPVSPHAPAMAIVAVLREGKSLAVCHAGRQKKGTAGRNGIHGMNHGRQSLRRSFNKGGFFVIVATFGEELGAAEEIEHGVLTDRAGLPGGDDGLDFV